MANYIDNAYKDLIYTHPDWQKTADEYEARFAANLYKTDYVQAAAKTALTKLSSMLTAYYGVKEKREQLGGDVITAITDVAAELSGQGDKKMQILEEALLSPEDKDSSDGAGQIGNARQRYRKRGEDKPQDLAAATLQNYQNLEDVIYGDGNLREQMTMLYNGMFVNGGFTKEQIAKSHSLKNMLLNITEEDLEYMRRAGVMANDEQVSQGIVRLDLLEEMSQYRKGEDIFDTHSMARDLKKGNDRLKGRGNWVTRFWQGLKRGFSASATRVLHGIKKDKEEQKGLGLSYYENLGLSLSAREKDNGINPETGELQWKEGQAYYRMDKPVTAEGLLQTAGPSGTTVRMLGAYKLLGATKQELLYFRLALIAWMVSSKDHSLFEILKGSHNVGVVGYEDLSEAANMYKTVDPIPEKEIRERLAPDGKYPHETIYLKLLNEMYKKREELRKREVNPLFNWIVMSGGTSDPEKNKDATLYDATDIALNIYSSQFYKVMNAAQRYGSLAGRYVMKKKIDNNGLLAGEQNNPEMVDRLLKLARLSSRIAEDGIAERSSRGAAQQDMKIVDTKRLLSGKPEDSEYAESFANGKQAFRGFAFRGGKVESWFRNQGAIKQFSNLTSTSMAAVIARSFYKENKAARKDKAIVRLRLTGKGAVSIMNASTFTEESEVLVAPGSRFKVVRALSPAYMLMRSPWTVKYEDEMNETEWQEFLDAGSPDYLKKDGTEADQTFTWHKIQMVELEEISGAGENRHSRLEAKRNKKDEVRRRLLTGRQAVQTVE